MITLPNQLNKGGFRFIKLNGKVALEKEWQKTANYNEFDIQPWLELNNNYGVLCNDNLIVVDSDTPETEKVIAERLPKTFTVKTAKGLHRYYFCAGFPNVKIPGGDIKSDGGYVVGPNCKHPSGATYEVVDNSDILTVTKREMLEWLKPLKDIGEKAPPVDITELMKPKGEGERNDAAFKIATFFHKARMSKEDVLRGLQTWNAKNLPPMPESELVTVVNSALRGEPYKVFYKQDPTKPPETDDAPLLKFETYEDMVAKQLPEQAWLVDRIIPAVGVTVLGGKRSTYKSWMALELALSVAAGKAFMGHFETQKGGVIYINNENDDLLLVPRLKMLANAAEIKLNGTLAFLNFQPFKFTKAEMREQLEAKIDEIGAKLIICDPFSGTHDLDENDAGMVRGIFTEVLGEMANRKGVAFVLIHHMRKGQAGGNNNGGEKDYMDELRGSSEFANYVSSILITERKGTDAVILRHIKSRAGEEYPACVFAINSDEQTLTFDFAGYGDETQDEAEKALEVIIEWAGEEEFTTKTVLAEIKDFKRRTLFNALTKGVQEKSLTRVKRGVYLVDAAAAEAAKQKKLVQ